MGGESTIYGGRDGGTWDSQGVRGKEPSAEGKEPGSYWLSTYNDTRWIGISMGGIYLRYDGLVRLSCQDS